MDNKLNRIIAVVITATTAIGVGVIVANQLRQPHEVYLPLMQISRETLKSSFGAHGIRFGFSVSSNSFKNPITLQLIHQKKKETG